MIFPSKTPSTENVSTQASSVWICKINSIATPLDPNGYCAEIKLFNLLEMTAFVACLEGDTFNCEVMPTNVFKIFYNLSSSAARR